MWVPPGKESNRGLWRYDVAARSFLPPGVRGAPKGIQVEMPDSYSASEPKGFHMVASPAGTQAPVEHINYTPETGEIHGRGMLAPMNMLNYTLLPEESLGAGHGSATGSIAQGMGAGAGAPSLSAFGAPQPFAGTPPLIGSPTMMGESPTSNAALPQWGGGGTPFGQRMGMGQAADEGDDAFGGVDPNRSSNQPAAPAAAAPAVQPADPNAEPPPPINPITGQPFKPDDALPVPGIDGRPIAYRFFTGWKRDPNTFSWVAQWELRNPPAAEASTQKQTVERQPDGSYVLIDMTKTPPTVTPITKPDPTLIRQAEAQAEIQRLTIEQERLKLIALQQAGSTAGQEAQLKLEQLQAQVELARTNADRAAAEAAAALANLGKAPLAAKPSQITDINGQILERDDETGIYHPTGIYVDTKGEWRIYNEPVTQTVRAINLINKEDIELAPMDPYKEYPPQKAENGKWIQWDPGTKRFKVVYQEEPEWETQWSGDELIRTSKRDGKVEVIWRKKPTQAEDDAHTAAIDAHNTAIIGIEKTKLDLQLGKITAADARVKLAQALQDVLHPKPIFTPSGSIYAPPGLNLTLEDWDPMTGQRSTRQLSGGPIDPRIMQTLNQAAAQMNEFDTSKINFNPEMVKDLPRRGGTETVGLKGPPTTSPSATATPSVTAGTVRAAAPTTETVGETMTERDWQPGDEYNEVDPDTGRLRHVRITEDWNYEVTPLEEQPTPEPIEEPAPEEGSEEGSDWFFNEETGRRFETPNYGFGNEGRMGAGMAGGETGWVPRPNNFAPAAAPGFLGGAGQDESQYYDEQGNPLEENPNPLWGEDLRKRNREEERQKLLKGFAEAQEANRETQRVDRRPGEEGIRSATLKDPKYDPRDPRMQPVYNPGNRNPDEFVFERSPTPGDPREGGRAGRKGEMFEDRNNLFPAPPFFWEWPYAEATGGGEGRFDPEQAGWELGRRNPLNAEITQGGPGATDIGTDWTPFPGGGHVPTPPPKPLGPNITTLPPQMPGGHTPGPEIKLPGATDEGVNWTPDLKGVVKQRVNEPLGELQGWPKLEETPPTGKPYIGTEGGFDQPEVDLVDLNTRQEYPPSYPTDERRPGWVRDVSHLMGIGGTHPEDWQEMQAEEGIGRATGKQADPAAQAMMERLRMLWETMGTGQDDDLLSLPPMNVRQQRLPGELGVDRGGLGGQLGPEEGWYMDPLRSPGMRGMGLGDITPGATGAGQDERDWANMGYGGNEISPTGSFAAGYTSGYRGGTRGIDPLERVNPSGLPRMPRVNIDPMQAFGAGQGEGMMPPSGGPPSQIPPQGPGGEQPPAWLLTLLQAHPELFQQAGLPTPPGLPGQPAGGGSLPGAMPPTAPPPPSAGWQPPGAPQPGATPTPEPSQAGVGAPSPGGGPMIPPLDGQDVAGIGHRFGQEMSVGEPQHSGVDLQAPEGTPTKSPVDGFVQRVEDNPQGLGVTVIIRGLDGSEHRLGHLKSTTAYAGMQVKMGQDLGSPVGETGMTTGAHLHWGVRDGQGQPADPTQALGPMASMPPVPGTEMMGPPGGVGGGAQMGQPQMGGGADNDPFNTAPYSLQAYSPRLPLAGEGGRTPGMYGRDTANSLGWPRLPDEMLQRGLQQRGVLGTGQEQRRAGWRPRRR